MSDPSQVAAALEACFTRIHAERMADVPLLNPRLRVQTVGFRRWGGNATLGVLVTPWFMNLVLWPDAADASPAPGNSEVHEFPSGRYSFVAAIEPGLGRYQLCSLFSPMYEFEDQAAAVATAEAALAELLAPPKPPEPLPVSRRQWLRGMLGDPS